MWRILADHDDPHLPLQTGSVTACVILDALPYLRSPRLFLQEIARVLEPGGHLLVSVPNARQVPRVLGLAFGRPISLSRIEEAYDEGQRHLFTDRSLGRLLEQCGFVCEQLIGLLPVPRPSRLRSLASRSARSGIGRAWLAPGVLALGRRR